MTRTKEVADQTSRERFCRLVVYGPRNGHWHHLWLPLRRQTSPIESLPRPVRQLLQNAKRRHAPDVRRPNGTYNARRVVCLPATIRHFEQQKVTDQEVGACVLRRSDQERGRQWTTELCLGELERRHVRKFEYTPKRDWSQSGGVSRAGRVGQYHSKERGSE